MRTIDLPASRVNPVYRPYLQCNERYQIYYGGSSSGKSFFLAMRTVLDCLCGRNYLIARKVARTLRGSCWNEVVKAITAMNLAPWFQINKSELTITAINNGCQIMFVGLDDVEKVKSITPQKGTLTDIWLEEATEAAYEDYKQLDKRLRGLSTHSKRFTLSFNPVYVTHWIYKEFFDGWDDTKRSLHRDGLSILKTTHVDNLFLAPEDHAALENEHDEYFRNVYALGNWGVLGDVIFKNWKTEDLTLMQGADSHLYFGLDFGFSADPATIVKVRYSRAQRRVYVLDELYERGLTNEPLAQRAIELAGRYPVSCDCAEPKSIAELCQYGVNAIASRKGADSVLHGVQWLQGQEIIVDPRCRNVINELTVYQWRRDKDGNALHQPQDCNNHCIDALRYALEPEMHQTALRFADKRALGL